jgi:hypothetical protein
VENVIRIRTGERNHEALHYADDIDEKRDDKGESIAVKPAAEPLMNDILAFTE